MLSINTNLSSSIAQQSLSSSTIKLNQAIERMTTGAKINHAKDNAANYSISKDLSTKISSYDIAANNVAMGMDLVTTASDLISTMQKHAQRLEALSIQSRNGTYGQQSIDAINAEAAAIMAEINRLYSTAEYNNVSLFNNKAYEVADHLPKAGASGFIDETAITEPLLGKAEYNGFIEDPKTYTDEEVAAMTALTDDITTVSFGQKYSISTVDELVNLTELVNSGVNTTGVEFVLGADIDLSAYSSGTGWVPIGNNIEIFRGIFDGNGHVIKNLTINDPNKTCVGLFYVVGNATIKNLGLENVNISAKSNVGGLVGSCGAFFLNIKNCYVTGSIKGAGDNVGGLVGDASTTIENCYTDVVVTGANYVGGLVGNSGNFNSTFTNSYTTGNVTGNGNYVGGFIGKTHQISVISNCYSTCDVTGADDYVGGLAGDAGKIINSYSKGNVIGTRNHVGGLAGAAYNVNDCYSISNVEGINNVGALLGLSRMGITNCYATGDVIGITNVAGLIGEINASSINNSYATGSITGDSCVGGLVGSGYRYSIKDSTNYTNVSGNSYVGAIAGKYSHEGNDLALTNVEVLETDQALIGASYNSDTGVEEPDKLLEYDELVSKIALKQTSTTLQVGINSDSSCQIDFDTNFFYGLGAVKSDITSDRALEAITKFINQLSEKSTQLGAVQNRLDSALESIEVNLENLVSTRSTIRDADIAEESSAYIRQQILQQASATLLATANQSPSIALQLI